MLSLGIDSSRHQPQRVRANLLKYNTEGFTQKELFTDLNVHDEYASMLADTANMAVTENTKAQYKTAVKHIQRVAMELNVDMSLPFDLTKTLNYVGFLLYTREVSAKTVNQYLSGVRYLHLCRRHDPSCLRPPIVSMILKGREHWENVKDTLESKPQRVAVTLRILRYLKRVIRETSFEVEKKLRLWAICCLLWNGSLRVHELLSKHKNMFDPLTTLCKGDIELVKAQVGTEEKTFIRLHLKSPKERRIGTGVKLEIFGNQTFCCPVSAWQRWEAKVKLQSDMPVFMEGNACFTGAEFNRTLSNLTAGITDGTDGVIRPHSFRSGMATEMALRGFTDEEIQSQGRWSSRAFESYIKKDRLKRLKFTEKIGAMITHC